MEIKFSHQTQFPKCDSTTTTIEGIKHGAIYECQHCGVTDLVEFVSREAHNLPYVYIEGENICVGKNYEAHLELAKWTSSRRMSDVRASDNYNLTSKKLIGHE